MAALPHNDVSDPPYNTGTGETWRMGGSTPEIYMRRYNYSTNDSVVHYTYPQIISASMTVMGGARGITINTNGWRVTESDPPPPSVEEPPKPFKPIRDGFSRRIL